MMIPVDPIMSLIVVVGVFIYCAMKGNSSPEKKGMSDEEFIKWFAEQEEKRKIARSPEYRRYQNWLYDHRPEE